MAVALHLGSKTAIMFHFLHVWEDSQELILSLLEMEILVNCTFWLLGHTSEWKTSHAQATTAQWKHQVECTSDLSKNTSLIKQRQQSMSAERAVTINWAHYHETELWNKQSWLGLHIIIMTSKWSTVEFLQNQGCQS